LVRFDAIRHEIVARVSVSIRVDRFWIASPQ